MSKLALEKTITSPVVPNGWSVYCLLRKQQRALIKGATLEINKISILFQHTVQPQ